MDWSTIGITTASSASTFIFLFKYYVKNEFKKPVVTLTNRLDNIEQRFADKKELEALHNDLSELKKEVKESMAIQTQTNTDIAVIKTKLESFESTFATIFTEFINVMKSKL